MCGIAGIVARRPLSSDQKQAAAAVGLALKHRGPDGAGHAYGEHFAFAARRLSIIDLVDGIQPLHNEDKSLVLICNGEIYNHIELRRDLEALGHKFATHSDCEVILHLYEELGERCVQSLRGMFAFALWDYRKRRLLLARDRMGEKPLYVVETNHSIAFASELKAIVEQGLVPFALEPSAVNAYFHFGYVPESFCIVKGVRKVPAGHTLVVDIDPWKSVQKRYWKIEDAPPLEGDPATLIRAELERISEGVVRADVPIGVSLSGGIDSSAVAALAARNYKGTLQAVTVGYAGHPRQDERDDAKDLADALDIQLHVVELDVDEVVEALPSIHWLCDDPIGDIAGPAYYFAMKRAREEGLRVMLSGHGGDELFWGYDWVRDAVHATRRKRRARLNQEAAWPEYLRLSWPPVSYTGGIRWLRDWGGMRTGFQQRVADMTSPADRPVFYDLAPEFQAATEVGRLLYTPAFASRIRDGSEFDPFAARDPDTAGVEVTITRLICESYLVANGLAQLDRLAMASSVETRQPLVDHRLVEVVTGLRKHHSDVDLPPKQWLHDAVKGIVPDFVMRRNKRSFTPPWRQWARATADRYASLLADGYLVSNGVLDPASGRLLAKRLNVSRWGVPSSLADYALSLEFWCRAMESAAKRAPAAARLEESHVVQFKGAANAH